METERGSDRKRWRQKEVGEGWENYKRNRKGGKDRRRYREGGGDREGRGDREGGGDRE